MEPGVRERVDAACSWAGHHVDDGQRDSLDSYARWLESEAIPAGGLGPGEGSRIWPRHVVDSLTFSVGWENPPRSVLDVGTGVGLPGIPLAILWPNTEVTLLDRGGRRVRLLDRGVRLLGLSNVEVMHSDVAQAGSGWEAAVWRASVPLARSSEVARRLLMPGGVAVIGLGRRRSPPEGTAAAIAAARARHLEPEVIDVPDDILDGPAWLLIMTRCSGSRKATR